MLESKLGKVLTITSTFLLAIFQLSTAKIVLKNRSSKTVLIISLETILGGQYA